MNPRYILKRIEVMKALPSCTEADTTLAELLMLAVNKIHSLEGVIANMNNIKIPPSVDEK